MSLQPPPGSETAKNLFPHRQVPVHWGASPHWPDLPALALFGRPDFPLPPSVLEASEQH